MLTASYAVLNAEGNEMMRAAYVDADAYRHGSVIVKCRIVAIADRFAYCHDALPTTQYK